MIQNTCGIDVRINDKHQRTAAINLRTAGISSQCARNPLGHRKMATVRQWKDHAKLPPVERLERLIMFLSEFSSANQGEATKSSAAAVSCARYLCF